MKVLEIMSHVETLGDLGIAQKENTSLREEGRTDLFHFSLRENFRTKTHKLHETEITVVPLYLWGMPSKTPSGCLTPRIVLSPAYTMLFPLQTYL